MPAPPSRILSLRLGTEQGTRAWHGGPPCGPYWLKLRPRTCASLPPGEGTGDRCLLFIIVTAICSLHPAHWDARGVLSQGLSPKTKYLMFHQKKVEGVHLVRYLYRQCDLVHVTGSCDGLGDSTKHPCTVLY